MIMNKPELSSEINTLENMNNFMELKQNDDEPKDNDDEPKKKSKMIRHSTIKNDSPFNQHFITISESITNHDNNLPINPISNVEYIQFLLDQFMPYCAIWASFCFRGKANKYGTLSRLTNGVIEAFWGHRKDSLNPDQAPAIYANNTYKQTKGKANCL